MFLLQTVSRLKRTKVQILLGFVTVMIVVLSVAGVMSYRLTSEQFIRNTKSYVAETAEQASGRIDALLAQIDSISMLLVMDPNVQNALFSAKQGSAVPVQQRLALRPTVDNVGSLSWLIEGVDLYTEDEPLYPLQNQALIDVIGREGLDEVRRQSGQLVWIGAHPDNPTQLVAVRQVRLEQDYLTGGGYIVVKVANSLGDVFNTEFTNIPGSSMYLFDQQGKPIASTSPPLPLLQAAGAGQADVTNGDNRQVVIDGVPYLHMIEQSKQVNWSIHILVPLRALTDQLSMLMQLSIYALIVGAVLCFILTWFLSERITMPIRKLRRKMSSVHISLPQTNEETYFNLEMNELNQAYNKLVRDLHRLIATVYEEERLKNRAEIKMLQAQIHPHFLFNTLETLYWSLTDKDREGARLVIALSKLFRYSIKTSRSDDWVTLHEEIEHCRLYLEIMKFRLAHRLTWEIRMPEPLASSVVPKLLVQPLVENAILHGIEPKLGSGSVTIDVQTELLPSGARALVIRVRDNGPGLDADKLARIRRDVAGGEETSEGGGMGMMNVARRIRMHYGENYGLAIDSILEQGTEIRLILPYRGAST